MARSVNLPSEETENDEELDDFSEQSDDVFYSSWEEHEGDVCEKKPDIAEQIMKAIKAIVRESSRESKFISLTSIRMLLIDKRDLTDTKKLKVVLKELFRQLLDYKNKTDPKPNKQKNVARLSIIGKQDRKNNKRKSVVGVRTRSQNKSISFVKFYK